MNTIAVCHHTKSSSKKSCKDKSITAAKKKDRKECNESNDKVREMLCRICGTISDKNAQLTLKCSLKRKITRYETKKPKLYFLCYWLIFFNCWSMTNLFVDAKRETLDHHNKECKKVMDMMTVFSPLYQWILTCFVSLFFKMKCSTTKVKGTSSICIVPTH